MSKQSLATDINLSPIPPGYLNLMGYVDESEVNGPGCRAVVWVQGCLRHCPQCFNPDSWSFAPNQIMTVEAIAQQILNNPQNTGVTFSGGEPFWQAPALAALARLVKAEGLNVMSFTGFTLQELHSPSSPPGAAELLAELDLLIDGPYIQSLAVHTPNSPVSSTNQRLHIFNPQLQRDSITWASDQIEIHVMKNGDRLFTGYRSYKTETRQ